MSRGIIHSVNQKYFSVDVGDIWDATSSAKKKSRGIFIPRLRLLQGTLFTALDAMHRGVVVEFMTIVVT